MKTKRLLFAFALLVSATCVGQDSIVYKSVFGDSSTMWNIYSWHSAGGGTNTKKCLSDDTIVIDGLNYNILRHVWEESWWELEAFGGAPLLLRESEDHSKLFFRSYCGESGSVVGPEILIMDLGLEVGDTLDTHGWSELDCDVEGGVPSIRIDSIFYKNNKKILQTNLYQSGSHYITDTLFFIEGVGPSFGPYYPRHTFPVELNCHFKDDSAEYHGINYYIVNSCRLGEHVGADTPDSDKSISIYPNPTNGAFNIQSSSSSAYKFVVRDSYGRILMNGYDIEGTRKVDIGNVPPGVYYVTICTLGFSKTIKLVKI